MSFLIDVLNGVQKLVTATPAAVGAEPALGNPGPGTWFLKTISGVRSWVASIPWAGVDKTGAVASDVGALPVNNPTATGLLTVPAIRNTGSTANAIIKWDAEGDEVASTLIESGSDISTTSTLNTSSGLRSGKAASDTVGSGAWLQLMDNLTSRTKAWLVQLGASNTLDFWNFESGSFGASPKAKLFLDGSLSLAAMAGTGARAVAADSTGKLVIPEEINIGDNASTSALTLHCGAANGARVQFANGTGVGTVSRWASWYQSASGKFFIEAFDADGGTQAAPALEIDNASSGVAAFARSVTTNSGIGVFGSSAPGSQPVVTGSKGGNAALASLITALASYGLIVDSTT
mgnify:CR=1 FL=1